jgi:hypothetical protein
VYDDTESADISRQLNAQAFTKGNDIFFGAGQYRPTKPQGSWLLAHELTHVVQQEPRQLANCSMARYSDYQLSNENDMSHS